MMIVKTLLYGSRNERAYVPHVRLRILSNCLLRFPDVSHIPTCHYGSGLPLLQFFLMMCDVRCYIVLLIVWTQREHPHLTLEHP